MGGKSFVCCYCGEEVVGFGNDPYDFSKDFYNKHSKKDLCCDKCYASIVTPRKMAQTIEHMESGENG